MAIAPANPHWRWMEAQKLVQYPVTEGAIRVKAFKDKPLEHVYKFARGEKNGVGKLQCPDVANAHEIYFQRPWHRALIEGMLIGGADNKRIMEVMECDDKDIDAYVNAFFDVRDRKRADVCMMVFRGLPHQGYHSNDKLGVLHRLGWFGRVDLIENVIGQGVSDEHADRLFTSVCRDIMHRQLPEMSLSASAKSELVPEYLKIAHEWDKEQSGGSQDELSVGIMDALSAVKLSVADPTVSSNLQLPKREPRLLEVEVLNVGT